MSITPAGGSDRAAATYAMAGDGTTTCWSFARYGFFRYRWLLPTAAQLDPVMHHAGDGCGMMWTFACAQGG